MKLTSDEEREKYVKSQLILVRISEMLGLSLMDGFDHTIVLTTLSEVIGRVNASGEALKERGQPDDIVMLIRSAFNDSAAARNVLALLMHPQGHAYDPLTDKVTPEMIERATPHLLLQSILVASDARIDYLTDDRNRLETQISEIRCAAEYPSLVRPCDPMASSSHMAEPFSAFIERVMSRYAARTQAADNAEDEKGQTT